MLGRRTALVPSTVLVIVVALAASGAAGDHRDKDPVGRAVLAGRFWGETPGPARSLVPKGSRPLFHWEGSVAEYAALEVTDGGVVVRDCGHGGVKPGPVQWDGKGGDLRDRWLVLTTCNGPGRVRVVQPMNMKAGATALVEIDDRDIPGASAYIVECCTVPKTAVDALHAPPGAVADRWAAALKAEAAADFPSAAESWTWIATHETEDAPRLWAIEKLCMARPYPGPAPSAVEQETLSGYAEKEPIEVLAGTNVILAWPKDYADSTPVKWRFLAEMDAALDWLKVWTGKDQVAARGKRLIVRFRVDDGGTALFVDFRLHIPRKEMRFPPDHGPCSHEASHGFIDFPSICPTGRYGEGLTEVSRTSFWWFLGLDGSWKPFRANCLRSIEEQRGKTLDEVPSYAAAAGVYFSVEDAVRTRAGDTPDWSVLSKLFEVARGVEVSKDMSVPTRCGIFAEVCEKALGAKAMAALKTLGLPK
jgi:hypothetical protein